MKAINSFSLGAIIAGAFIGAGFVSGQELWQFFGIFSFFSIPAFLLSILLITLLSFLVINLSRKINVHTFESVINPFNNKRINILLIVFEVIFYFSVYVIMVSGAESLFYNVLGVSKLLTGVIFSSFVTLVVLMGIKGIVSSFSFAVPLLILVASVISVVSVIEGDPSFSQSTSELNPLISNPLISALLFVSYNFYSGIGVFVSVSRIVSNKKTVIIGSLLGGIMLFLLGGTIILSITANPHFTSSDLPMLDIAKNLGNVFYYTYSILLILSMFSASASSLFPISEQIRVKCSTKKHIAITVLISVLSTVLSLIGFKELIGVIYPIFGYAGFVIVFLLLKNINKCK